MSAAPESSPLYRLPLAVISVLCVGAFAGALIVPQFIDDSMRAIELERPDVRTQQALADAVARIVVDLSVSCPPPGPGMLSTVSIVIDSAPGAAPRIVGCSRFTQRGYLPPAPR